LKQETKVVAGIDAGALPTKVAILAVDNKEKEDMSTSTQTINKH
jgi:hypothetical protein